MKQCNSNNLTIRFACCNILFQNFLKMYGVTYETSSQTREGGGGTPLLGFIRVRAAGQGLVFWPRCLKQGIQFDLPLS